MNKSICVALSLYALAQIAVTGAATEPQVPMASAVREGRYAPKGEIGEGPPVISPDGKRIAVVEDKRRLVVLDSQGHTIWTYKAPKHLNNLKLWLGEVYQNSSGITVAKLVVSRPEETETEGYPFVLLGFDKAGRRLWKQEARQAPDSLTIPAASGHTMLSIGWDGISLFDARNGRTIWSKPKEGGVVGALSPDGEYAVVTTEEGVKVIDKTGRVVWSAPIKADMLAITNSGRGVAAFRVEEGPPLKEILSLFDASGKELWQREVWARGMALDANGERLLVAENSWKRQIIYLFDRSGSVIWESPENLGVWDDEILWLSQDGRRGAFGLTKGETRTLYLLGPEGKPIRRALLPQGWGIMSADGERLVVKGREVSMHRVPWITLPSQDGGAGPPTQGAQVGRRWI